MAMEAMTFDGCSPQTSPTSVSAVPSATSACTHEDTFCRNSDRACKPLIRFSKREILPLKKRHEKRPRLAREEKKPYKEDRKKATSAKIESRTQDNLHYPPSPPKETKLQHKTPMLTAIFALPRTVATKNGL